MSHCKSVLSATVTPLTPLRYMKIKIYDNYLLSVEGYTNSDGMFNLLGSVDDVPPSVVQEGNSTTYPAINVQPQYIYRGEIEGADVNTSGAVNLGRLEVEKINGQIAHPMHNDEAAPAINVDGPVLFGEYDFASEQCRAYYSLYKAMRNSYERMGEVVPLKVVKAQTNQPIGNVPYALYTTIQVPTGYNMRPRTGMHEMAHAIRQRYDGSLAHFLDDVLKYWYPRNHKCALKSNEGFAFNEGWAEFWAGTCWSYDKSGPYDIEGNVAMALRALQKACRASDRDMWRVLRESSHSAIHSFPDYRNAAVEILGCADAPPAKSTGCSLGLFCETPGMK